MKIDIYLLAVVFLNGLFKFKSSKRNYLAELEVHKFINLIN